MKLSKIIFYSLVAILLISISVYLYSIQSESYLNPTSTKNEFFKNLNFAIQKNQIPLASPITFKNDSQQVEFIISQKNSPPTKIIFSTQKDPILQTTSLQQIFKIATINDKYVYLVDLSLNHPYATLKNN